MAKAEGGGGSEYARRAIKADIFRRAFRAARRELLPQTRAQGIYTDEEFSKSFRESPSGCQCALRRRDEMSGREEAQKLVTDKPPLLNLYLFRIELFEGLDQVEHETDGGAAVYDAVIVG